MIQLSFLVPDPAPEPAAPLRRIAHGEGQVRITGVWPHHDVAAARRQLAAYLAEIAPDHSVRCNLTGRSKPAAAWARELREPVTVSDLFVARHALIDDPETPGAQRLVARLFGLYQLGESDIVLIADGRSDVQEAYRFLTSWGAFRLSARSAPEATEPRWDRPFPWGYWLVSFTGADVGDDAFWALLRERFQTDHLRHAFDERMVTPPPRVVIEAADPADPETSYMIGATRALEVSAAQRRTAARLGVEAAPSPSAQDAAAFCDRIADRVGSAPLFAYREPGRGPLDSGWRFACLDPDHVHDETSLRIAPLARAAAVDGLIDYLALPSGWVVTFEDDAFWINAPGQAESHLDAPRDEP